MLLLDPDVHPEQAGNLEVFAERSGSFFTPHEEGWKYTASARAGEPEQQWGQSPRPAVTALSTGHSCQGLEYSEEKIYLPPQKGTQSHARWRMQ